MRIESEKVGGMGRRTKRDKDQNKVGTRGSLLYEEWMGRWTSCATKGLKCSALVAHILVDEFNLVKR